LFQERDISSSFKKRYHETTKKNDLHERHISTGGLATAEAEALITVTTMHYVALFGSADCYSTIWTKYSITIKLSYAQHLLHHLPRNHPA
jgi:hypothetical protein